MIGFGTGASAVQLFVGDTTQYNRFVVVSDCYLFCT